MGKEVVRALPSRFTRLHLYIFYFVTNCAVGRECFNPSGRSGAVAAKVGVVKLLMINGAGDYDSCVRSDDRIGVILLVFGDASRTPPILVSYRSVRQVFLSIRVRAFTNCSLMFTCSR